MTGLTWDVNPASAQWLDENRHRLDHAPVLAALGYGLGLSTAGNLAAARAALAGGLTRLMRRDPFQDRLTFVNDTRQVVGIGLAAQAMSAELPAIRDWLLEILSDERLQPADRFHDLLQRHVRSTLNGPSAFAGCPGRGECVGSSSQGEWDTNLGLRPRRGRHRRTPPAKQRGLTAPGHDASECTAVP